MKTLFILQNDMSIKNGGSICSKLYIDLFNEVSSKLIIMLPKQEKYAFDFSGKELLEVPERCLGEKLLNLINGTPHRFLSYIEKHLNLVKNVDLIVLSSSILGYGLLDIFNDLKKKTICIHHNYEPDYHKDNRTIISLCGYNLRRIKEIEKHVLLNSSYNITLTNNDIQKFIDNYALDNFPKIEKLGCFLNKMYIKEPVNNSVLKNKVVITGALCDKQTEDGIIYYLKNLHLILSNHIPNAIVHIAGRNPTKKLIRFCRLYDNVHLFSNPSNLKEIINDAILFINPTYTGSGLKLRNIDPLSLGVPVIAHEKSTYGYEGILNNGVWGYNSIDEFEEKLTYIINNPPQRKQIQSLFIESFSFNKALEKLSYILKAI